QDIVTAVGDAIAKVKELVPSIIILTSPIVRVYIKKLIDQFYPNVVVLSFSEIDSNIQIQALGNISLS
ncbi:MAG: FHIPEP family type III secretion protein, partial [Angelakisella sp.]